MIELAGVAASMACRDTRFPMSPNAAPDRLTKLSLQSVSLVGLLLGCVMAHWNPSSAGERGLVASAKLCCALTAHAPFAHRGRRVQLPCSGEAKPPRLLPLVAGARMRPRSLAEFKLLPAIRRSRGDAGEHLPEGVDLIRPAFSKRPDLCECPQAAPSEGCLPPLRRRFEPPMLQPRAQTLWQLVLYHRVLALQETLGTVRPRRLDRFPFQFWWRKCGLP
jgi:hypothetical protein